MALSRALKLQAAFRGSIKKGPDISMTNPSSVKGKSIKTYKDNAVKDGAAPNYAQDNNNQNTARASSKKSQLKLII